MAVARIVDIDYRNQNDRWVPSAWKVAHLERDGRLWKGHDVVVRKFEINPVLSENESLFVLQPSAGMVVLDEVAGHGYRLAEDGKTKLRPDGLAFEKPTNAGRFVFRLAAGIGSLLIIVVLVRVFLRRRSRSVMKS